MRQYLLSIYQPDGELHDPDRLRAIAADVEAVREEMRAAGAWVFTGGLHNADTATVLRPRGDEIGMTDGPYVEGKEHIGGLVVIRAPDLDAALAWGRRVARATTLPVEVRPLRDEA